jgi:hypothetical protein
VSNAAVEIVEDDHPAKKLIREHQVELSRRLHSLCREMGARRPEQLGDALSLIILGVYAARLLYDSTEQIGAATQAAQALIDSPAIGVGAAAKKR